MNVGLILSGGTGTRLGGQIPKQYMVLDRKEVISYSLEAMQKSHSVEAIVIVAAEKYSADINEKYGVDVAIAGDTRNESLFNGLRYIADKYPFCEKIFINEAARPFITADLVDEYLNLLDEYDAAITTAHITDSLGKYDQHTTDRTEYYLIQAPEAFRFKLIFDNFKADSSLTATVQQLPPNSKIYKNFSFRNNIKITYTEDFAWAEDMMRSLN